MKIHENSHSNTLLRILPTVMHKITHGFFSPKKFNDGTDFVSPGGFLRKIAKSLGKHDRIPGCPFVFCPLEVPRVPGTTKIGEITRSYASYASYAPGPPRRK